MIAGAICEETDCTGLVLILLAVFAAFVVVVIIVVVAWAATVSAVLERRGWDRAARRTTAAFVAVGGLTVLWAVGSMFSEFGAAAVGLVAVSAVPVAFWQRSVTKRYRDRQSSPCSTA